MKLARVVVRLSVSERDALDRLRVRYFAETRRALPRASVVRVLVHRALEGADARKAADVLDASGLPSAQDPNLRTLVPRSASIPLLRTLAPTSHDDAPAGVSPASDPPK